MSRRSLMRERYEIDESHCTESARTGWFVIVETRDVRLLRPPRIGRLRLVSRSI